MEKLQFAKLVESIESNLCRDNLDIQLRYFNNVQTQRLAEAITKNKSLRDLDLSNNDFSFSGIQAIAGAFDQKLYSS